MPIFSLKLTETLTLLSGSHSCSTFPSYLFTTVISIILVLLRLLYIRRGFPISPADSSAIEMLSWIVGNKKQKFWLASIDLKLI